MFKSGRIDYESPQHCLREVQLMIRGSAPHDDPTADIQERIRSAINSLKAAVSRDRALLGDVERLRLTSLECEMYQQQGQFKNALSAIDPVWRALKAEFQNGRLHATEDRGLLRQKIWALLHYFFVQYRLTGDTGMALKNFRATKAIIDAQLASTDYTPLGTLALCHYSIGLCCTISQFRVGEQHLLEAQQYINARTERELARKTLKARERRGVIVYRQVFCARVLSGLSRIGIQQGHLLLAEHTLYAAHNLLATTAERSMEMFVRSLLWISKRRRSEVGTPEHVNAMEGLVSCFDWYLKKNDSMGQTRCAAELACGYTELAEAVTDERAVSIKSAKDWLKKLPKGAPYPPEEIRALLIRSRLSLVDGDHDDAADHITEAAELARTLGLAAEYSNEIALTEVNFFLTDGSESFTQARKRIDQILAAASRHDTGNAGEKANPLAEAECQLLLGRLHCRTGNAIAAQRSVDQWKLFSRFIDNRRLHDLGDAVQAEINREEPRFERLFDGYDPTRKVVTKLIPTYLAEYKDWMETVLRDRYGISSKKDLARFYGVHPSNIRRKPTR